MAQLPIRTNGITAKSTSSKGTTAKGTGGSKSKATAKKQRWNGAGVPYSSGQSSAGSANSDAPF